MVRSTGNLSSKHIKKESEGSKTNLVRTEASEKATQLENPQCQRNNIAKYLFTSNDTKKWHTQSKRRQTAERERRGNAMLEVILVKLYTNYINIDDEVPEEPNQRTDRRK